MVAETKGTRMNTKALAVAASLWVPMVASAATELTVTDRQEALSAQLEEILAKTGISIGGSFRGEVGSSKLGGTYSYAKRTEDGGDAAFSGAQYAARDDEQIGYTSVDFDIRARPNTATTARAVFRMHLDHANFFGSPYVPIQTRWLSLDGGFFDMAYYHFGDMKIKWSPLVIGATEPGFLYTPRIFAQQQKQAMDERFIGGGARNLQGLNLGLRAAVPNLQIDSFDVSMLAAKLLSAGPVGAVGSINTSKWSLSGDKVTGQLDSVANFDRWALGGKGSVSFLRGITVGGNYLLVKDLRSTFGSADTIKPIVRRTYLRRDSVVGGVAVKSTPLDSVGWVISGNQRIAADTIIQNGSVVSGNLGLNASRILSNDALIAEMNVDVARSAWDVYTSKGMGTILKTRIDSPLVGTRRTYSQVDSGYFAAVFENKAGLALNLSIAGGWKAESWVAKIRAGYLMNDSLFRSDLAQSPVFFKQMGRIFNTEQDVFDRIENTYTTLRHYNTFDALYHNVHRYVAEDRNEYAKSPYDKLAYSNYIGGKVSPSLGSWTSNVKGAYGDYKATLDTIAAIDARFATQTGVARRTDSTNRLTAMQQVGSDKAVLYLTALDAFDWDRDIQLVLPSGEASANRVGPKFGLDFDLMQGGLEVKVDGYMLQEAKGTILDSANQLVAEKAKFQQVQAGLRTRIDRFITGWDKPIELSGSVGLSTAKGGTALNYQSTVINAGLYAGVIKRLAVLGGYQLIDGKDKAFLVDRKQSNMAGGLEFKVQEGAYLLGMYNLVKTEFPNAPEYNFDQTIWSTKISVSF